MSKLSRSPKRKVQIEEIESKERRRTPGRNAESRERKLISLSYDLVEERLRKKTATSQETTHFLKLGSTLAELEKEKIRHENKLLEAKTKSIRSQEEAEKIAREAIKAIRGYQGLPETTSEDHEA